MALTKKAFCKAPNSLFVILPEAVEGEPRDHGVLAANRDEFDGSDDLGRSVRVDVRGLPA